MGEIPGVILISDEAVVNLLSKYHSKLTRDNGEPDRHPKTQQELEALLSKITCAGKDECIRDGNISYDCIILQKDKCCQYLPQII